MIILLGQVQVLNVQHVVYIGISAKHGYTIDGDVDLGTVSGGNNDQGSAEDNATETSLEDDRSDVCRCSTEESEFSDDVDDSEASGMCQCTTSEGSKSDGESIDSDEETSDSTSSSFTEESFSSSSQKEEEEPRRAQLNPTAHAHWRPSAVVLLFRSYNIQLINYHGLNLVVYVVVAVVFVCFRQKSK